ncbi:MAG: response regulator [Mariniblastus sp.]|nr:response regulator [Mariniblastus sp.]
MNYSLTGSSIHFANADEFFAAKSPAPGAIRSRAPAPDAASEDPSRDLRLSKIFIVDDEVLVTRVIQGFLSAEGYSNFCTVTDSTLALERIIYERPDLILIDIMMPEVSGLDILAARQNDPRLQHIPVIVLSASSETEVKREALKLGATEFLSKPVDAIDLVLRVRNALLVKRHQDHLQNYAVELEDQVQRRTRQIEQSREQIVHCLAKAAEFRDNETGQHVIRVGKYAAIIAQQLGYGPNYCRQIELAAQLHDVGKIGIPDSILLNPGRLNGQEFDVMKEHCLLGVEIMKPLATARKTPRVAPRLEVAESRTTAPPLLELAASIAKTHHEKWDGTGYPVGLKGDAIPMEGRITCVADVYDALCSTRPYKESYSLEKCLNIMVSERGTRFDPVILDAFFEKIDQIRAIGKQHPDA